MTQDHFTKVCLVVLYITASVILSSGCANRDLSRSQAKSIIESQVVALPKIMFAKTFIISNEEANCAVREGLLRDLYDNSTYWSATKKGKDLGFAFYPGNTTASKSDFDSKNYLWLEQARLLVDEITGITGSGDTRTVEAKVSAKIAHQCFPKPVPFALSGDKTGLVFNFRLYDDGWRMVGVAW